MCVIVVWIGVGLVPKTDRIRDKSRGATEQHEKLNEIVLKIGRIKSQKTVSNPKKVPVLFESISE